jgi:hypothetical protein
MHATRWHGLWLLIAGLAALICAAMLLWAALRHRGRYTRCLAVVLEHFKVEESYVDDDQERRTYHALYPTFRFTDEAGHEHTLRSGQSVGAPLPIGEPILVAYPVGKPEGIVRYPPTTNYLWPILAACAAGFCLLFAYLVLTLPLSSEM